MILPEEIVYKILSYLCYHDLVQLNLSNKQYWNVYRIRKSNCPWDSKISWLEKLSDTSEMLLKDELYIHSFISLTEGYPPTFIPKIPVETRIVSFQRYLDGYIWHPTGKVDLTKIKQILNERDKSLTFFKVDSFCTEKILELFNKHILKHVWDKIPQDILEYCCKEHHSDDRDDTGNSEYEEITLDDKKSQNQNSLQNNAGKVLFRFPDDDEIDVFLVLYLTEQSLDLNSIDFADEINIDGHIIWRVFRTGKNNERIDIGRAVLSQELHKMMNYDVGIALFARENKVFGLGNFNYRKAERHVLDLVPKDVFETYNFVIVKKN